MNNDKNLTFEEMLFRDLMKDRIVEYDDLIKVKNMNTKRTSYFRVDNFDLDGLQIGDTYKHNNQEYKIINLKKRNCYAGLKSILPSSSIHGRHSGAGYVDGDKEGWTLKTDLD